MSSPFSFEIDEDMIREHREGVRTTLRDLYGTSSERTRVVELTEASLSRILMELFGLRWQVRRLQARGTELVEENRKLKRALEKKE